MDRSADTGAAAHADRAPRLPPAGGATLGGCVRRLAVLALLATSLPAWAAENRLAQSDDPYLLMHAHDPVDWYAWGPEALDRARREDKPIFLSVGFSACFWCHTMQRESFSDPAIAALLNASFVSIKVDREQRPELDALYGLAADVLAGQFGWPNNVFLTPDGRPFAAASYLPPHDDSFGQPGFDTMLATERDLWAQHRDQAVAKAERTVAAMREAQAVQDAAGQVPLAPEAWMARARDLYLSRLDAAGGLGGEGGKSPHAPVLALMLAAQQEHPDAQTEAWLRATLDAMAFGGIDDQLAGGFHRYSTDEAWAIPHYEKMLGDNAQLLAAYADAASLLHDPLYREVAIATGAWMIRELATPDGFLNSEDARSGDAEGASYLWSREEIASVLGAPAATRFLDAYAISSDQPAQPGEPERGVLRLRVPIDDTLARTGTATAAALLDSLAPERAALLAVRNARPQPRRNTQVVAAENGLAITALAASAGPLGRPDFLAQASVAAARLWDVAWDARTGLLHHELIDGRAQGEGTLDDYALLAQGALAMAQATGEAQWRTRAAALGDAMLRRFAQPGGGLVASSAHDLILPPYDTTDDPQPSGTAAAIALLLTLDDPGDAAAATRAVFWISGAVAARPDAWPAAVLAMARGRATLLREPDARQAATAGSPATDPARAAFAMPDTAAHVRADAVLRRHDGIDELAVTLHVDPGYHVNANPASSADLVATTLHVSGLDAATIRYPSAVTLHPSFTPATLDVYEGAMRITASLPAADGHVAGSVDVQACTMTLCLPPATLAFTASR